MKKILFKLFFGGIMINPQSPGQIMFTLLPFHTILNREKVGGPVPMVTCVQLEKQITVLIEKFEWLVSKME